MLLQDILVRINNGVFNKKEQWNIGFIGRRKNEQNIMGMWSMWRRIS
jgi:hypothetical protein